MTQLHSSIFTTVTSIGVEPKINTEEYSNIKIFKIFLIVVILFCQPLWVIMLFLQHYAVSMFFVIIPFVFCICYYLINQSMILTGKVFFVFITNFSLFTIYIFYGCDPGFYLYYYFTPLIVYSLFNFNEKRQILVCLTLFLLSYLVMEIMDYKSYTPYYSLSEEVINVSYYTNVTLSFCFSIILVFAFSKSQYMAYSNIDNKNKILESNQKELEQLINDKNTLLSETHHRVKNNLAVISGLFDLQMMYEDDKRINEILINSKNRIKSMSMVHESLYKEPSVSKIDLKKYVENLITEIQKSLQTDDKINIDLKIEAVHLDLTKAIPCGLIINEVLTNCFKHAFNTIERPAISVQLSKTENMYHLKIKDNGVGFDFSDKIKQQSLGLTLIDALSKQLEGQITYTDNNGSNFDLIFK